MTTVRVSAIIAATMIIALFPGGCKNSDPSGPTAGLGGVAVTKYVAIGNSLTAGYQSGGLFHSGQMYSFSNLIAKQLTAAGAGVGTFQIPYYSDPGTPDPVTGRASRYELISLAGPVIGPLGLAPGAPENSALARPYDNLGIPGAVIMDFLDTNAAKPPYPRGNTMFALVLRIPSLGRNQLEQAVALNPDLVTFWLGNNDVLGYATSGGVSPTSPTPTSYFQLFYTQALTALHARLPRAKIAVANIPDIRSIPFFTTVGPKIGATLAALPVYLRYQKHGNTSLAFDSTRFTEANPPFITLPGSSYAPLLGRPGGKWYRDNKYPALPAGIDTTKPFGFHPQNPWPDALVLDVDEQVTAGQAVADFNSIIATQAAAVGAVVVDINAFFNGVKKSGYEVGGITFTADYISGGLFSLDGVHPSARGYGVLANQFLMKMNSGLGMSVPMVDVGTLPGIPSPLGKGSAYPIVDPHLYDTMHELFGASR